MNSPYALRYRFFFRSRIFHILLPKLPLRMATYLFAIAFSTLIEFNWGENGLIRQLGKAEYIPHIVAVYLAVGLYGELALRVMLKLDTIGGADERSKRSVPTYFVLLSVLPLAVYLLVGIVVLAIGDRPNGETLNHDFLHLALRASLNVLIIWLCFYIHSAEKFGMPQAELSYLRTPSPMYEATVELREKFAREQKEGVADQATVENYYKKICEDFAYGDYRAKVAGRYLMAPPDQAPRVLRSLPYTIVFEILDPFNVLLLVEDCGFSIQYGELQMEHYRIDQDGRHVCKIRYGLRSDLIEVGTTYTELNKLFVAIAQLVSPVYGIRQCLLTSPGERPRFMSLPKVEWSVLEAAHGRAKMNRYFTPVDDQFDGLNYYDSCRHKLLEFIRLPANQYVGNPYLKYSHPLDA